MKKLAKFSAVWGVAWILFAAVGCAPSSPDDTPKVDGMTPADYREKGEPSQKFPGPGSKAKGSRR